MNIFNELILMFLWFDENIEQSESLFSLIKIIEIFLKVLSLKMWQHDKENRNLVWVAVLQELKAKEEKRREKKWAAASYIIESSDFWASLMKSYFTLAELCSRCQIHRAVLVVHEQQLMLLVWCH